MKKLVSVLCSLAVIGASAAYLGNSVNCEKASAWNVESYVSEYLTERIEEDGADSFSGFAYAVGADKVKLKGKIYTLDEYKNGAYKEEDQYKYYVDHKIDSAILRNDIAYQLSATIKGGKDGTYALKPLASYFYYDGNWCMRLMNKYELIVMAKDEKTLADLKERIEKEVKTDIDKSTIKYEVNPEEINTLYKGVWLDISFGDFDGNDKVDSKDAVLILQYYAGSLAGSIPKDLQDTLDKTDDAESLQMRFYGDYSHADANDDWVIDSKDAVKVLQDYAKAMVKKENSKK